MCYRAHIKTGVPVLMFQDESITVRFPQRIAPNRNHPSHVQPSIPDFGCIITQCSNNWQVCNFTMIHLPALRPTRDIKLFVSGRSPRAYSTQPRSKKRKVGKACLQIDIDRSSGVLQSFGTRMACTAAFSCAWIPMSFLLLLPVVCVRHEYI